MDPLLAPYLLIFCLAITAYFITTLGTPVIIRRAFKLGVVDLPGSRKVHTIPTPRLGGLAIIPIYWLSCAALLIILNSSFPFRDSIRFSPAVIGFFLGSMGMFIVGLFDDVRGLAAPHKLFGQAIVAFVCLRFFPLPESVLGISIHPLAIKTFIFMWLVTVPNSVNLLDGIDGLTGSLLLAFLGSITTLTILRGEFAWLIIFVPVMVSVAALLRYNWNPAKIFLGDSGSLLLGFTVAYFSLYFGIGLQSFGAKPSAQQIDLNIFITLSLAAIWLTDTLLAICRRYFRNSPNIRILIRRSVIRYLGFHVFALQKIFQPDRSHIHHRLLCAGISCGKAVLVITGLAALPMFVAISSFLNSAPTLGSVGITLYSIYFIGILLIPQSIKPDTILTSSEVSPDSSKQVAA